jgi:hypothetical protein
MATQTNLAGNTTIQTALTSSLVLIPTVKSFSSLNTFSSSIMPRDAASNIMISSGSNNTKLIIDTYDELISKKLAVKYLDTRFNYFKFPATTVVALQDININLDTIELNLQNEYLFAKYVLSGDTDVNWAAQSTYSAGAGSYPSAGNNGRYGATGGSRDMPSGSLPVISSFDTNGTNKNRFRSDVLNITRGAASGRALIQPINTFSSVEAGNAQLESGGYKITQLIKESGKDLRFRIQIKHYYESGTDLASGDSQKRNTAQYISNYFASSSMWFSVIKTGTNGENKQYRGAFTASFGVGGALQKTITRYETQTFVLDTIVPNYDFAVGDVFKIGGISKYYISPAVILDAYTGDDNFPNQYAYHKILKAGTYWSVTDASKNVDINNQPL